MQEGISIQIRRSQLGRVRGTGAAKSGVHHWLVERITAVALVPLTLWFIVSMVRLAGAPQEAVVHWAGHSVNAALLLALVAMTFHHMHLGLQVIYEDYINAKWLMNLAILLTRGVSFMLALLSGVAILKMALA